MAIREYYQAHKERMREQARKYRAENRERYREQWKKDNRTYRATEAGKLKNKARIKRHDKGIPSESCEVLNCNIIGESHHDDYTKPLEIRWLCKIHHEEHHHKEQKT